jgi:hypothetical protein
MPYQDFHLRVVLLRQQKRDENNCCEDRKECCGDQPTLTETYGEQVAGRSVVTVFIGSFL